MESLDVMSIKEQHLGIRANQMDIMNCSSSFKELKSKMRMIHITKCQFFVLSPLTMPRHLDAPNRY